MPPLFAGTMADVVHNAKALLATIRLNAQPFTRQFKKIPDTVFVVLERSNFEKVKDGVISWLDAKGRVEKWIKSRVSGEVG